MPRPPASLRLGYNSSGFARTADLHAVIDAVADIGFAGLELSIDERHHHSLLHDDARARAVGEHLRRRNLGMVLGTGGRYVLGPNAHEPAFATPDPAERERFLAFLETTMDQARPLGTRVIMLHSGYAPRGVEPARAWSWLVRGARRLARRAGEAGLKLGFEFHPDMLVRTLDIGHVACTDPRPIPEVIRRCADQLVNVHLEDIRGTTHVHLPIGDGDIDFATVFEALRQVGYGGLINAEFNSDDLAVDELELARQTWRRLHLLLPTVRPEAT